MRTESINKFKEMMDQLEIKDLYLQGDNTNFYQDGENVDGNCIIFDDTNEMAWGVRVNNNFPMSPFRITTFDYEQIQYLTMEASREQLFKFLDLMGVDPEIKNKFKSQYDKGRMNHVIRK